MSRLWCGGLPRRCQRLPLGVRGIRLAGGTAVDGLPPGGGQLVVEDALEPVPAAVAVERDFVDRVEVDGRALVADRVVGELAGADLSQPLRLR